MAISPRTYIPLFAGANVGILPALMWWDSKARKKGFNPLFIVTLGLLVKFGGFAGRVRWRRGTNQLPCPFKSLHWRNGILDLAAA